MIVIILIKLNILRHDTCTYSSYKQCTLSPLLLSKDRVGWCVAVEVSPMDRTLSLLLAVSDGWCVIVGVSSDDLIMFSFKLFEDVERMVLDEEDLLEEESESNGTSRLFGRSTKQQY